MAETVRRPAQRAAKAGEKVMAMREAVARFVRDGDLLYASGFTHLIPMAAGHLIIRQGRRDLVLARATPDLIYEQMIVAGTAKKLIFSYIGNPGVGSLRAVRRAIEAGQLEIEEYSHYGLSARLWAGAANLPFAPVRTNLGTDLPQVNPLIRTITCPYTGERLSTVPALRPDVAIIHAQRADRAGNTHLWGILGEQREAAFASDRVILTVEEIVDHEIIASDPNRTVFPGFIVDAVVEEPWCAHPSHVQGYYDRDNRFYLDWGNQISKTDDGIRRYLDEWVYPVPDRQHYLTKIGHDYLQTLVPKERLSVPVNYGEYS